MVYTHTARADDAEDDLALLGGSCGTSSSRNTRRSRGDIPRPAIFPSVPRPVCAWTQHAHTASTATHSSVAAHSQRGNPATHANHHSVSGQLGKPIVVSPAAPPGRAPHSPAPGYC